MIKIVIFGGGVGGCTVAHELSKFPQYDISIYERKKVIGGLARSSRDPDLCATEYCWRVYFSFYKNLFKTMSEIPLIENSQKSVIDNLTGCHHTSIADRKFTTGDKIIGLKNIISGITACDARLDELDDLTWYKALDATGDSHLFRAIGPWLGADRYGCSYKSVIKVGFEMDIFPHVYAKNTKNYISTKPTSEAWFVHWEQHLIKSGVKINYETELDSVQVANGKIVSAVVKGKVNKVNNILKADYYVFALPVEVLDTIVNETQGLQVGEFLNINKLRNRCLHMQLSFQLYFNKSISIGRDVTGENNSFLLVDSPWDIIVLQYDKIYTPDVMLCHKIDGVKGGWSVAACTAYIPGVIFGKPFNKCNYGEIIIELWAQMYQSQELQKLVYENNGFYLEPSLVIKWSPMWPTYKFDERDQKLKTAEPKFTNNAGTWKLRPSYRTPIQNLFISTAYVRETIDIFSTEAANIAGKYVASSISNSPKPTMVPRPVLLSPFRAADSVFYKLGLPNWSPWFFLILIILLIILLGYGIKKIF